MYGNFFLLLSLTDLKQRMMLFEKIAIFEKNLIDSYNCIFLTCSSLIGTDWNPFQGLQIRLTQ